jgi:hypothetical protein
MNKEFIPYEQAFTLKELGFDEPCFGDYYKFDNNDIHLDTDDDRHRIITDNKDEVIIEIPAPLYQQVFRWFREEYSLVHEISWSKYKGGLNFDYDVFSLVLPTDDELGDEDDIASDKSMETYDSLVDKDFRHHESNTYEEAELACLIKLIEIVKKK